MIRESSRVLDPHTSASTLVALKQSAGVRLRLGFRRNLKPLLILLLLVAVVTAMATVLQARSGAIVRAPGVLYPATYVALRAPRTAYSENVCRVVEIYKQPAESVQAGDPILHLDSSDEVLQRDQARRLIQGHTAALKDCARLREERILRVQLVKQQVQEAAAQVEAEKALLAESQAVLKRAGAENMALEINVAKEKLKYAEQAEERARITYENNKAMPAFALTDENMRNSKLDYDMTLSASQQARDSLALLQKGDAVSRLETAEAQVAYRRAVLASAESRYAERQKEVQLLEVQQEIDVKARLLEGDLEKARLEEQRLEKAIADKTLRAPISGVLHQFNIQSGQWVTSRETLGLVCDTSAFVFHAQVLQRDLPRVQPGQRARVYLEGVGGVGAAPAAAYEAEVLDIGDILGAAGNPANDPLGLFQAQLPKTVVPANGIVRLRLLRPVGGQSSDGSAAALSAPALRAGFTGQARILVGAGRLAELFF